MCVKRRPPILTLVAIFLGLFYAAHRPVLASISPRHCSADGLAVALPAGAGLSCRNITVTGLPSTQLSLVAKALRLAVRKDQALGDGINAPTRHLAVFASRNHVPLQSDRHATSCTVVAIRDFRDVMCAVARRHGGCAGCSAVAMEAKLKHWMHRLFHDPSREHWATWLPKLEASGARLLRYECWSSCDLEELAVAFQVWLRGSEGGARAVAAEGHSPMAVSHIDDGPSFHAVGDWRTCFTEKTRALVNAEIGDLLDRFGYSPVGSAATCAPAPRQPPSSPEQSTPVPLNKSAVPMADALWQFREEGATVRLDRFRSRVGALQVVGVDDRFSKRILHG